MLPLFHVSIYFGFILIDSNFIKLLFFLDLSSGDIKHQNNFCLWHFMCTCTYLSLVTEPEILPIKSPPPRVDEERTMSNLSSIFIQSSLMPTEHTTIRRRPVWNQVVILFQREIEVSFPFIHPHSGLTLPKTLESLDN